MNFKKILDLDSSLHTDDLKREVYNDIKQFVYKYHTHYFPHFKGELDDLVTDFYVEFTRPKKHRNGEVFSELDRFKPEAMGGKDWTGDMSKKLAVYCRTFVVNRLIDRERTDKGEVSISENYDENTGELTLDRVANIAPEEVPETPIEFTSDMLAEAKERFASLSPEERKAFMALLRGYIKSSSLSPDAQEFFQSLVEQPKKEEASEDFKTAVQSEAEKLGGKATFYKLGGAPAVKISFESKDAAKSAFENEALKSALGDYAPYVVSGSNCYYKKSAVTDSENVDLITWLTDHEVSLETAVLELANFLSPDECEEFFEHILQVWNLGDLNINFLNYEDYNIAPLDLLFEWERLASDDKVNEFINLINEEYEP